MFFPPLFFGFFCLEMSPPHIASFSVSPCLRSVYPNLFFPPLFMLFLLAPSCVPTAPSEVAPSNLISDFARSFTEEGSRVRSRVDPKNQVSPILPARLVLSYSMSDSLLIPLPPSVALAIIRCSYLPTSFSFP